MKYDPPNKKKVEIDDFSFFELPSWVDSFSKECEGFKDTMLAYVATIAIMKASYSGFCLKDNLY